MFRKIAFFTLLLFSIANCASERDVSKLDAEIAAMRGQLEEASQTAASYKTGSPIHSLITLRKEIYAHGLAMLQQKRDANLFYVDLKYTTDGASYAAPSDKNPTMEALRKDIDDMKSKISASRAKAMSSGGLLQAVSLLTAETDALALTQMEYRLSSLKFDFPMYLPNGKLQNELSPPTSNDIARAVASESKPVEDPEQSAMKTALAVRLLNKNRRPSNYRENVFEDQLRFKFEYENLGAKDIRAFTGLVIFKDIFNRPFYQLSLTADKRVPSHKKITDADKGIDFNQFKAEHQQLATTEMENLRVDFEPASIMFTDGTQLGKAG